MVRWSIWKLLMKLYWQLLKTVLTAAGQVHESIQNGNAAADPYYYTDNYP